ncbi:PTS sugar transporter subunit IIC [Anaerorhabdus sp.]|uniref:PTS sugar transporter subunit IIC n=1 Tax=Anaerorhabdus sp. TaxID=1872524 RepID=UPI002B22051A|nr:PTS transporter subunit EIIC [Anaerorhabdus sp.]MEA4875804.1 PTS transporter subunit EIIC [Anaerorhabdus sp.]
MNISKFQETLMKFLMPIANKVEQQKHLQAIKDGMIASIPIIVVGSICLLPLGIMNLLGSGPVFDFIASNLGVLTYASGFTMDLLSLYAVYFIAKSLSEKYDLKGSQPAVTAIVVQLILSGVIADGALSIGYLGASGLFTAIVSAIITVEVYHLCYKKNIYIKLPDSVPAMVGDSFASLVPLCLNVIIAVAIATISLNLSGSVFPQALMSFLAPAISTMDTLPALLIVVFLTQLLWFFGLHGPSITSAVWAPFAIAYGAENIANYAAGLPVSHIFTFGLYYCILQVTGSGLTLGLNLLMVRSKAKSLSSIGKVGLVPSLFGINEPLIFGTPILLNPFMFIPFVFGPLIATAITYFSMTSGLVGMPIANPPGFLPPGVGAFLMTLDWKAVVLVVALLILMTLIYYPFFKMMEADELKKESENNN